MLQLCSLSKKELLLCCIFAAIICRCDVIVDPFCGCGGNAIQFAMTCHMVIAIDIDPKKIAAARINAAIYKVEHRIEFIVGDAMTILPQLKGVADVIFLSPPWGGPTYSTASDFDLNTMIPAPLNGIEIYRVAHAVTPDVVYFLPRNCSISQLSAMATEAGGVACEIETQWLNGKLKTKAAYFGDLAVHAYTSSDDDDDDMFTTTANVTTTADQVKQLSSSSTHVRFTDDDDMDGHDAVAVSLPLTTAAITVDQCKEDSIYSQWVSAIRYTSHLWQSFVTLLLLSILLLSIVVLLLLVSNPREFSCKDRKTVDTTHHKELSNAIAKGSSAFHSMDLLHAVCSIFNARPTTLCTQVNKIFEARLRAATVS
jgi:trimethylguanosine synthase